MDELYRERAHLVALLAATYPSRIGYTDPETPDWKVLTIDLPTGQASWHISPDDLDLFTHVRETNDLDEPWDGHTTEEKLNRIRSLTERITSNTFSRSFKAHMLDKYRHLM